MVELKVAKVLGCACVRAVLLRSVGGQTFVNLCRYVNVHVAALPAGVCEPFEKGRQEGKRTTWRPSDENAMVVRPID